MLKFGEKFTKIWPEDGPLVFTEFGKKLLGECAKIEKNNFNDTTIADIINISSNFPIEFGTNTCRIKNQPEGRHTLIRDQLASAYPVVHERALYLYAQFLEHKYQYGEQRIKVF